MTIELYQIDAFADTLFMGNPAAICPLEEWLPDEMMQKIAMENNLSETAFFVKEGGGYRLRWFTPKAEVDLCGHATLASAHVLFKHTNYDKSSILFYTQSGELTVTRQEGDWYAMNFPAATFAREAPPLDLYHALGGEIADEVYKGNDFLWVLDEEETVRSIKPDFNLLAKTDMRGVIVTAPGTNVDFVSRFFAPGMGINEDPVTGSAHTLLIPYWADRLDKKELIARQISQRGGTLKCRLLHNNRVEIKGEACTFFQAKVEVSL